MNKESKEERRPFDEIGPNEFGTRGIQEQMNPGTKGVVVAPYVLGPNEPSDQRS